MPSCVRQRVPQPRVRNFELRNEEDQLQRLSSREEDPMSDSRGAEQRTANGLVSLGSRSSVYAKLIGDSAPLNHPSLV